MDTSCNHRQLLLQQQQQQPIATARRRRRPLLERPDIHAGSTNQLLAVSVLHRYIHPQQQCQQQQCQRKLRAIVMSIGMFVVVLVIVLSTSMIIITTTTSSSSLVVHGFTLTTTTTTSTSSSSSIPKQRHCSGIRSRSVLSNGMLHKHLYIQQQQQTLQQPLQLSKTDHNNNGNNNADDLDVNDDALTKSSSNTKNNNNNNNSSNNNNEKKKTRKPTKQQRFAQPNFLKRQRSTTTTTKATTINNSSNNYYNVAAVGGNVVKNINPTTNTNNYNSNDNIINRDRMWKRPIATTTNNNNNNNNNPRKTGVTIEDLEKRLMQRYGTDLTKYTSGEYDDDDDDDDEIEEVEVGKETNHYNIKNNNNNNNNYNNNNIKGGTTTNIPRSPSVYDPWEEEEMSSIFSSLSSSSSSTITTTPPTKGKSNQITSSNTAKNVASTISPLSAFGNKNNNNNNQQATTITNSASLLPMETKTTIDLSHLIAAVPVGGRGTNNNILNVKSQGRNVQDNVSTTNSKNKINNNTMKNTTKSNLESSMIQPILDSNGKPMLLTIQQAQRLFDETIKTTVSSLSSDSSRNEIKKQNTTDEEEDDDDDVVMSWNDLSILNPLLIHNLKRMNCEYPLPSQCTACPNIVSGMTDVVIGTYTGSGKTLAVLVPIIERILTLQQQNYFSNSTKSGYVKLIIVAPGRELASQIATVTRTLLHDTISLSCMLAIGGTTYSRNYEQIRKRKPDIIVGTPGRLAELIVGVDSSKGGGRIPINNVQAIVLDEFDALLSYPPHSDPVNALMEYIKRFRGNAVQTIMCSATASDMISNPIKSLELEGKYLRPGYKFAVADKDDVLVTAMADDVGNKLGATSNDPILSIVPRTATRVSRTVMHGVVHVPHKRFALDTLRRILHTEPIPQQILIFVADSRKVNIVVDKLADVGIIAAPLHGGMDSEKVDRAEVSRALREGYVGIVVATEMAARGLDAPLLTHVINMDLPTDSSHYAHRAGRCGRGGRPGVVINLTTSPQERGVPMKLAAQLGVQMYTIEVKNAKLNVIDPKSQVVDGA